MNKNPLIAIAAFVILLVNLAALPAGLAAAEKQPSFSAKPSHYKLRVLPTLGGVVSIAQGINNKGEVVGSSDNKKETTFDAFRWQHGAMKNLGHLPGGNQSLVFTNPSERGDVSGFANTGNPDPNGEDFCLLGDHHICLGFLWRKGVMKALPTLGGNNSTASGVSNQGEVAGVAENNTPDFTCTVSANLQARPVIWKNGEASELPTIDGDADGWAYWINDRGQIVGYSGLCYEEVPASSLHAVLWQRDHGSWTVSNLGSLGGSTWNIAFYINDRGQVVGQSGLQGDEAFHAFLWTKKGGMQDLGTLPGDVASWANDINNKSQAVGTSFDVNSNEHPFIWQNGKMNDLNTLIPPHSPLYLLEAFGINDQGQIAGWGQIKNGDHRGFLLTPCKDSEPGCEDNSATATRRSFPPAARELSEPTTSTAWQTRNNLSRFPVRGPKR